MDFRLQAGMKALTFNCDGSGRTAYEAVTSSSCVTDVKPYIQVVIAAGSHLFPFRTEKLSPPAPMVLQCNAGE